MSQKKMFNKGQIAYKVFIKQKHIEDPSPLFCPSIAKFSKLFD